MSLEELRAKIDSIDLEIMQRLNERAKIVQAIGKHKHKNNSHIIDPAREKVLLKRLEEQNPGPLSNKSLKAVYREIISGAYELEREMLVSYLGPEGSFSHQAARSKFGSCVGGLPVPDIRSVFQAVAKGKADFGIVPVENSIDGGVSDALDTFIEINVSVCAELLIPIDQCLLSKGPRESIARVYSKPQALAQCRRWLRDHLPHAELVDEASTARAAQRVTKEAASAAIASRLAAELYGLDVVAGAIQDGLNNVTRFVVLGTQNPRPTGDDKTSIMFRAKNEPGALCKMLEPLKERGLNLAWLDYRPSRDSHWDYVFFIDIKGHREDSVVLEAIEELEGIASALRVLGSYPVADPVERERS